MKYTVTINQKAIIDNGLDLDIIDCAIIDYIKDFAPSKKIIKAIIEGEEYFWIQYEHFIKEMPILGITNKRSLQRRIDKIIDAGILEKKVLNGNSTYFRFGVNYDLIISDSIGIQKDEGGCTPEYRGGGLESTSHNNNTNNTDTTPSGVVSPAPRVKKKKVEIEKLPLPTKEEVLSFIGDTGGTRKIYSILELPNMTQSFSLQDILDLKNWMITFFIEKYPSRIFKNKEGELEGGNIILDELDKFYGYYLQKPEVEIKSVKGRMINWIITSTKPFNPKK